MYLLTFDATFQPDRDPNLALEGTPRDLESNKPLQVVARDQCAITAIAFTADDRGVLTGDQCGMVR